MYMGHGCGHVYIFFPQNIAWLFTRKQDQSTNKKQKKTPEICLFCFFLKLTKKKNKPSPFFTHLQNTYKSKPQSLGFENFPQPQTTNFFTTTKINGPIL